MIAHIRQSDQTPQTVIQHNINVAEIAARIADPMGLYNTLFLTGLFHDLGKNTEEFKEYIQKASADPKSVVRGSVNHTSAGGKYIHDTYFSNGFIQKLTAQIIATAIISHHGLTDMLDLEGNDKYTARIHPQKEIQYEEAIEKSKYIFEQYDINDYFQKSVQEIRILFQELKAIAEEMDNAESIHFLTACLERLVQSILVDADWTDTTEFMEGIKLSVLSGEKRELLWKDFQQRLNEKLAAFTKTDKISELRKGLSQECYDFARYPTGIYCLPIPTGGGKTYCSLRYALEHAIQTKKERILYIAPYLSILEQNAEDIQNVLQADEYIIEHHSNVVIEDSDDYEKQKLTANWVQPMVLTTFVAFLNACFNGKMQDVRRMHQLTNAVIIIDEIQSIPVKCIHMFNTMMNFLSRCMGSTIILCSATQPLLGEEVKKELLYSVPSNMIKNVNQAILDFKRVEIQPCLKPGGYDYEELADFILERFEKNMLVILNTKSAVDKLYQIIKKRQMDGAKIFQLTTYKCAQHRSDEIKKLKKIIKKEKVLCISTQLIEAGVDISFQKVVRAIAGLDSILQAAGRCNRNGEDDKGWVYIVNIQGEKLSFLKDIDAAQGVMYDLLAEWKHDPKILGNDLQMKEAIDRYYKLYFFGRQNEMDYDVKGIKGNLYDLLSRNQKSMQTHLGKFGNQFPYPLAQAFKEAGRQFEVIDNQEMVSLIVPYNEGRTSISILKNSNNFNEIKQELRKLQRYTVNLFMNDRKLKELIACHAIDHSVLNGAVYILDEGFYNEEEGISTKLEQLMF